MRKLILPLTAALALNAGDGRPHLKCTRFTGFYDPRAGFTALFDIGCDKSVDLVVYGPVCFYAPGFERYCKTELSRELTEEERYIATELMKALSEPQDACPARVFEKNGPLIV